MKSPIPLSHTACAHVSYPDTSPLRWSPFTQGHDLEELNQTMQSLTASLGGLDGGSLASVACSCAQIAKAKVGNQRQQVSMLQSVAIQAPKLVGAKALLPADMVRIMWALATSRQRSRRFWADMEQPLIDALSDDELSGKDLALVSWSYARAGARSTDVFAAVEAKVQKIMSGEDGSSPEAPLAPRDTSMLVWAFATHGAPAPTLCEAIAPLLVAQAPAFSAWDVSTVLWGLSTVAPQAVQARAVEVLEQQIIYLRPQFTGKGLGILLLGLGRSQHGSELLWRELEEEVMEREERLRPQELVTIASSFAKSGRGSEPLYDHLEALLLRTGAQLKPHELATSLWAFATARPGSDSFQNLIEELSPHLLASSSRLDARGCPQVLWACAQAKQCPSGVVLELLWCSVGLAPSLTLQGVSMTLKAARALKGAGDASLPGGLLAALGGRVTEMEQAELLGDQRALAGALLGFAHLQHPCPEAFGCLLDAARLLSSDLEARNLANVLWAAAAARHRCSELFSALEPVAISRSEEFEPAGLCQCVWAYATAGRPAPALFGTLELSLVQQKESCSLGELAQAAWAFAKAGEDGRRILEAADEKLLDSGGRGMIEPGSMAMLVWAVATHDRMWGFEDRRWPGALVASVEEHLAENTRDIEARELAICARSLAATGRTWSPELAAAVAERALELQDSLEPQDISNLLWSFARINAVHPGLFDAMDAAIAHGASQLSCQGIANSIWAFGRVDHIPSQALVEASMAFVCANAADFKPEEARMTLSGYRQMNLSVQGVEAALFNESACGNEDVYPTQSEVLVAFKDAGSWYG